MPPPPIPPIQSTIIINAINTPGYPQPIDYEKFIAPQHMMLPTQIVDPNSIYKLNDISNNSIGNVNNQKSNRHSHGGNISHLKNNVSFFFIFYLEIF